MSGGNNFFYEERNNFFRALRLHYAFNIDHRNKRMEGIYSRQYVMFLVSFMVKKELTGAI